MFRLAGKGFAAVKKGCGYEAVAHGGSATRGLFAFLSVDIVQLKSTSVVTRRHSRLRRKGSDPTEVNREGFERARNLPAERPPTICTPPLYGLFELIVSRVYFCFQIQSYVSLLTVRRLIELTRNPVFVFKSCDAILITIRTCVPHVNTQFYLYRNFIRDLLAPKIEAKNREVTAGDISQYFA